MALDKLPGRAITDNSITVAKLTNLTTSDVSEGSNLYFTDTRAIDAFTAGNGVVIDSNGLVSVSVTGGVTSVAGADGDVSNTQILSGIQNTGFLTTSNITEVSNLYFSNSRAYSNTVAVVNGFTDFQPNTIYSRKIKQRTVLKNDRFDPISGNVVFDCSNSTVFTYWPNGNITPFFNNLNLDIGENVTIKLINHGDYTNNTTLYSNTMNGSYVYIDGTRFVALWKDTGYNKAPLLPSWGIHTITIDLFRYPYSGSYTTAVLVRSDNHADRA